MDGDRERQLKWLAQHASNVPSVDERAAARAALSALRARCIPKCFTRLPPVSRRSSKKNSTNCGLKTVC